MPVRAEHAGAAARGIACVTAGNGRAVTGGFDPRRKARVAPQCVDRRAPDAVYCSCRCANENGRTDDGASHCACSAGFECTHAVTSIGAARDPLAGSYCIKTGTAYDPSTACNAGDCDPITTTCP